MGLFELHVIIPSPFGLCVISFGPHLRYWMILIVVILMVILILGHNNYLPMGSHLVLKVKGRIQLLHVINTLPGSVLRI